MRDHEFRVLGPIELWSAGQQHDLGSARSRVLLAVLLLAPRTVVPAETLIDRLWDTRPPEKVQNSLFAYVSRLRGSLRQALGDSVQLHGHMGGYVLDADPETIDVHRFRRLRRQAEALTASADYEHAAELLREAAALWRGPALSGVNGDWVGRMRDSLGEEQRAALLARIECDLHLGCHADLVGELYGLLTRYPLDELLIGYLMTALYRSGRPGDALRLYRETRDRLVEHQGTEPGPALARLQPNSQLSPRTKGTPLRSASSRGCPGWGRLRSRCKPPASSRRATPTGCCTSTSTATTPPARRWAATRHCANCCACSPARPSGYPKLQTSAQRCGGHNSRGAAP